LFDLSVHISNGCLVVPVQGDIDDEIMQSIQKKILVNVEKQGVKGVVIDLSGVKIVDPYHADIINKTAKMIKLLGASTVLSGIRPGVAISLSDYHFEFDQIYRISRTFEDGVEMLQSIIAVDEEAESKEETEVEEIEVEEEFKSDEMVTEEKEEINKEQSSEDQKFNGKENEQDFD